MTTDYSKDEFQLISYKHPKCKKLVYRVIHINNTAPYTIWENDREYIEYGHHACGTYDECSRLIQ